MAPAKQRRLKRAALVLLALAGLGGIAGLVLGPRRVLRAVKTRLRGAYTRLTVTERCLDGPRGLAVCVASDMAKLPNHGPVPHEGWIFSPQDGVITLDAARNETVAFQVVLKAKGIDPPVRVRLEVSDLQGPAGARIVAAREIDRFLAHYAWVEPGGYTWGGGSGGSQILPWPDLYPDALIPFRTRCLLDGKGGLRPGRDFISTFEVPPREGQNQAVWIDIYVPPGTKPGAYRGAVTVAVGAEALRVPLRLRVHPASLPQRSSIHAVGELYDTYRAEGQGHLISTAAWQRTSQCYQQLAHRHRVVLVERPDDIRGLDDLDQGAEAQAWRPYDAAFGPALSGELFTPRAGYHGPGSGVPVSVWRVPWPQPYNGRLGAPLAPDVVAGYQRDARAFATHAAARGWRETLFYAYVFDEVEGPTDDEAGRGPRRDNRHYVAMVHEQMRRVQGAIDKGAPGRSIQLAWTSHVDPSSWVGKPGLDLRGIIRLWIPNAGAAGPAFLRRRTRAGEQAWFYHHGHPAVGVHAINASGIEMRTWGVITARYGLSGHFMWACNFGDPEEPYRRPTYKNSDDRFGNGTMVYPGAGLVTIGWPALDEPVPSMRLKSWLRGLQDAELVQLARTRGKGKQAERLLEELIPRALGEGAGEASWPRDSGAWHRFRMALLGLAGGAR